MISRALRNAIAGAAAAALLACIPTRALAEQPPAFLDSFAAGSGTWDTTGGSWSVSEGRLWAENADIIDAFAHSPRAPLAQRQTVEVTIVPHKRLAKENWSVGGLLIYLDPSTFWVLGLTEAPDGTHYFDFLEKYQGIWQAQSAAGTRLVKSLDENLHFDWKYGTAYRLRLAMDDEGISATVMEAPGGGIVSRGRYEFGKAEALRMGTVGLFARGCAAAFDDVLVRVPTDRSAAAGVRINEGKNGNIAMLSDAGLPDVDLDVGGHLASALSEAGFGVTPLSAEQVCDPALLNADHFFLYIIPQAEVYPADGAPALMSYLRRRGHLMVLGGPAFTRQVWQHDGKWIDRQMIRDMLAKQKATRTVLSFDEPGGVEGWTRATNAPAIESSVTSDTGHDGTGKCMRYHVADLTGWTTYQSPVLDGMFAERHQLLCFWAKGDAQTTQLSVEVNETDGSRWIATVPLATEWQHHVLAPDDFAYWPDSKTRNKRGASGDRFNPAQGNRLVLGLAQSHTPAVGGGPHTLWVDDFGTARHPFADAHQRPGQRYLPMETITPKYKTYPLGNVAAMALAAGQTVFDPALKLPTPTAALSPIPRPTGTGFGNKSKWRWMPLANALNLQGERRGVPLAMLLNNASPYKDCLFATVGVTDPISLKEHNLTQAMVAMVKRMGHGVFLREAGARHFSCWPDEPVELGAEVANLGKARAGVTLDVSVVPAAGGRSVFSAQATLDLDADHSETKTFTWQPGKHSADTYLVRTELRQNGQVIDAIEHELGILSTAAPLPDDFVTVKGNDFYLKGKKWYPVGVNFWPLYVSGSEPGDYSLGWLTPGFYDPGEVERDLVRMEALGINMVSIQMGRPDNIRNLLDFMRRCEKHNIKVNGFLGTASPLGFDGAGTRAFIQEARLASNPTLFAYDTIWEPGNWVFRGDGRDRWDRDWEAWIVERYGSVENAEADWQSAVPRADGKVTSPSDKQMREDGQWRVMVAAYRRFMDDLMSRKWNDATRKLRKLDPNHLITFRQGNTLPQDFAFTATPKHIDFIEPEGYSIPLSEDGYDASGFITRYVHFTTGGKPIIWAEFGKSVWDRTTMEPVDSAIATQAAYHEQFYRMVVESGANGTAPWWWPGGYRVNERSDYGITNPNGTPRASAEHLRAYAPQMKAPRTWPRPDTWMTLDRDAHPGGYWHLTFNDGKDAYHAARAEGKHLGIRTEGTGTDSTNCPLVAVGNTPYTGKNPPKYLNAEFNWLQVRDANGAWVDVQNGAEIAVTANAPVLCRASVGNTQEAKWVTPASVGGKPGAVYLASTAESSVDVKHPIPSDTSYLSDADFVEFPLTDGVAQKAEVALQMTAEGRAWFGEKRRFSLAPSR